MSYSYIIDHDRKWVVVNRSGVLTGESILTSMAEIQADPEWDPIYDTLADCLGITQVDMDLGDIQGLAVTLSQEDVGKGRVALVVGDNPDWWALGEYFEQACERYDIPQHRPFRKLDMAKTWLTSGL